MGSGIADGTCGDEPTPGPNGTAPFRPRTRPARVAVSPRPGEDVGPGSAPTRRTGPPPADDASGRAPVEAEWTFSPDHAFVQRGSLAEDPNLDGPEAPPPSRPRTALAPRVGVVVIVAGLAIGIVGVFHEMHDE